MDEQNVVNQEVKETPQPAPTQAETTTQPQTESAPVVKPAQPAVEDKSSKIPYSRFAEVVSQKNELAKRAEEFERKLKDYESRFTPQPKADDPFAELAPEERKQTEEFVGKFIVPKVRENILKEISPFLQDIQNEKLTKQISEAKGLADKVGVNFDERLPEIVDFLSRPENKGRLTAAEAFLSLYKEEILDRSRQIAKDEVSKERDELMEKKKLANNQVGGTPNPSAVVNSAEASKSQMNKTERLQFDIQRAIDLDKQGVRNKGVTRVRG